MLATRLGAMYPYGQPYGVPVTHTVHHVPGVPTVTYATPSMSLTRPTSPLGDPELFHFLSKAR